MVERHVRLFKNGRNQALRIPREFELPGEEAIIRKDGQRLIIEPLPAKSLLGVLASLATLEEDFAPIEDRPAQPAPGLLSTAAPHSSVPRERARVGERGGGE